MTSHPLSFPLSPFDSSDFYGLTLMCHIFPLQPVVHVHYSIFLESSSLLLDAADGLKAAVRRRRPHSGGEPLYPSYKSLVSLCTYLG